MKMDNAKRYDCAKSAFKSPFKLPYYPLGFCCCDYGSGERIEAVRQSPTED